MAISILAKHVSPLLQFPSHLSQVSPLLQFHSLKACLEAKCLFCSTFHSINGNFHSLEACLILAKHVSPLLQFLILAKSLLCCNFHSFEACLPCGLPPPSQVSVLHFRSIPISIASRPAILAKCLFCSTFHSINGNFHSLLAACLILAKCLFCSTFHRIHGNVHPSQVSVLLHFLSHPWQFP